MATVRWIPVLPRESVNRSSLFSFVDKDSTRFARRFYRTRLLSFPPPAVSPVGAGFASPSNWFVFKLIGLSGQTAVVEASTNLVNWQPLYTNVFGPSPVPLVDRDSTNYPSRFYRARPE
jgi:hypothetical protein